MVLTVEPRAGNSLKTTVNVILIMETIHQGLGACRALRDANDSHTTQRSHQRAKAVHFPYQYGLPRNVTRYQVLSALLQEERVVRSTVHRVHCACRQRGLITDVFLFSAPCGRVCSRVRVLYAILPWVWPPSGGGGGVTASLASPKGRGNTIRQLNN